MSRYFLVLILAVAVLLTLCSPVSELEYVEQFEPTQTPELEIQPTISLSDQAQIFLRQGKDLLENDQCAAAIENLEKAVEFDPTCSEVYLVLGNAYSRSARANDAIGAYEKALEINDQYAAALTNLGAAYLKKAAGAHEIDASIEFFNKALTIEPDDAETLVNLGSALLQASQIPQARKELEKAISLEKNLAEAYVSLGYSYLLTGELEKAQMNFEKSVELEPNMPEALYAMGITCAQTGQLEKSIQFIEAFLATELSSDCKGDLEAAAPAREQAETILEQLRTQVQ